MKNKEKGITLVSLVVTIIVLIILAGVSINIIIGQDGIITKAKQAAENMELATAKEQERLNELSGYLSGENIEGGVSYDKIAELNQKYNTLKEQYDTLNQSLENTTAETFQILSGQTAYSMGSLVTGTMPNNGGVNATINAGESYIIPEGYHNGTGKITSKAISGASSISAYNSSGDNTTYTGDVTLTAKKDSILVAYIMSAHCYPTNDTSYFEFNVPSDAILLFANKTDYCTTWLSGVDFRGYYLPSGGTINLKGRENAQVIKYSLLELK